MWLFVHLAFLTGFRNRFTAGFGWATTFIGRGRQERTITIEQVLGRAALEAAGGRPFLLRLVSRDSADDNSTTEDAIPR